MNRTEIIQTGFHALATGDVEGILANFAADIEINVTPPGLAGGPAMTRRLDYRGHEGLRDWMREKDEDFSELNLESRHIEEMGDLVLVLGTVVWEASAGGGGMTVGWVCHFDGCTMRRIDCYWDWNSAREAARAAVAEPATKPL